MSLAISLLMWGSLQYSPAGDSTGESAAERGFRWLTTKAFLPPDFDDQVFENLWRVWPAELRERAKGATPAERRQMAFERYGLMDRPEGHGSGTALGYVADGRGGWVMNCLACHTGQVAGKVVLGSPNAHYALETLTDDVRLVKLQMLKALGHMELGALNMPLGTTRGTTNAVMFGVALGSHRDKELNFRADFPSQKMVHHDMDAPPFWNVKRKRMLYSDGFVAKSHRPLLQFVMIPRNSGATLKSWEGEFADILAWIESLEAPKYPFGIDQELAGRGKLAFERTCARCHGTYGEGGSYPERTVSIDEVQTDPVRLHSLSTEYRRGMQESWFGHYGERHYELEPKGYVAPPLDGIWASSPYLHNGSVPTLWHLLHPSERPVVWKRSHAGYDRTRVGLEIESGEVVPVEIRDKAERREYFDTTRLGKSAQGHPFGDELSDDEKPAVLEYLKSL